MPDINSLPPSALSPPPLSSSSASALSPAPASGSVSASASAMSANANANGSEPVPAHGPNSSPSPNRSASTSLQAAAAVNAGLQHERSSNSRRMMLPNPDSNPGQSRHSYYRLHTLLTSYAHMRRILWLSLATSHLSQQWTETVPSPHEPTDQRSIRTWTRRDGS